MITSTTSKFHDTTLADRYAAILRLSETIHLEAQCMNHMQRHMRLYADMSVHDMEHIVQQRLWDLWQNEYDNMSTEDDPDIQGWSLVKWAAATASFTLKEHARGMIRGGFTNLSANTQPVLQLDVILDEVGEDTGLEPVHALGDGSMFDKKVRTRISRAIDPTGDPAQVWNLAIQAAKSIIANLNIDIEQVQQVTLRCENSTRTLLKEQIKGAIQQACTSQHEHKKPYRRTIRQVA